jgi:hypothetical protein
MWTLCTVYSVRGAIFGGLWRWSSPNQTLGHFQILTSFDVTTKFSLYCGRFNRVKLFTAAHCCGRQYRVNSHISGDEVQPMFLWFPTWLGCPTCQGCLWSVWCLWSRWCSWNLWCRKCKLNDEQSQAETTWIILRIWI